MIIDEENFWIYMLGVVINLPTSVFRLIFKYDEGINSPFNFALYVLSSWIGLADTIIDIVIDCAVRYYKFKQKV